MKISSKVMTLTSILLLIGCQKKDDNKFSLEKIYDENRLESHLGTMNSMRDRFTMNQGFGTQKPYAPIVTMPQTVKVWVPDRYLDEDDALSQGHWVHLKLYDGDFAIKRSNPTSPYGLSNLPKIPTKGIEYDANVVHEVMSDKKKADGMSDTPSFGVPVGFQNLEQKRETQQSVGKEGDNEEFDSVYR